MMDREAYFASLAPLQAMLRNWVATDHPVLARAAGDNPWFIPSFVASSLTAIADDMLEENRNRQWLSAYPPTAGPSKRIGLILAGNLPLVGFHDVLSVVASGHIAVIKPSDKDRILLPALLEAWQAIWPGLAHQVEWVERLQGVDAVIATGTDNTARHFEYYFRQHPRLLRGHRNSIALLDGNETAAEMAGLMEDIFLYFGLGCRNVSALLVPEDYDFAAWHEYVAPWSHLADHHKYKNNLDYNLAIYMINGLPHLNLGPLILRPDAAIASRIGCVHFRTYSDRSEAESMLDAERDKIQCVVSRSPVAGWQAVMPGRTQRPQLEEYADSADTMNFLQAC